MRLVTIALFSIGVIVANSTHSFFAVAPQLGNMAKKVEPSPSLLIRENHFR